jgi:SAM-dependent methyltransferase
VFGAMFAPRPDRVASELFRVVKPGGTVGMANWGPYGSQGEMFELMSRYGPPLPDGVPNPRDWGVEEIARERLEPYASSLQLERVATRWQFDSFEHAMQTFGSAGPSVLQRQSMSEEQLQQLAAEAAELMQRHNRATDGTLLVEPEYLQIVARKRG